jgi:predicted DNA-binding transcriptional regulator AlpA
MSTSQQAHLSIAPADRAPQQVLMSSTIEIIDAAEMAARLKVKESWVIEESKPSRTSDPIPVFRLGKHRRYRWGSPEMNAWLSRRLEANSAYNRRRTRG